MATEPDLPKEKTTGTAGTAAETKTEGNKLQEVSDVSFLDFEIDPNRGQERLREFGYYYTKDGKCRDIKENKQVGRLPSQEAYEKFGEAVEDFIFYVVEHYAKMQRINLPQKPKESLAPGVIFTTPDYTQKKTLLFIIPGSGAVRASQWARSICINDSLAEGTCIPFIQSARQRDWGVILCDPNARLLKSDKDKGRVFPIEHCQYVFQKYVVDLIKGKQSAIENILIVAHSAGGWCTSELLERHAKWLTEKNLLKGIAFTDCGDPGNWILSESKQLYRNYGQNWVTSSFPLDTPLNSGNMVMKRVSAGHQKHEWTSACAYPAIFKYFDKKLGLKYTYLPISSNTSSGVEDTKKDEHNNEKKKTSSNSNEDVEMKQELKKSATEGEVKNLTSTLNEKMRVTTDDNTKKTNQESNENSEKTVNQNKDVDMKEKTASNDQCQNDNAEAGEK